MIKKVLLLINFILFLNITYIVYAANELLFYESFDNSSSVLDNNGTVYGILQFTDGLMNNAINFSGNRKVCYPIQNNLNISNGTIEFWVKPPLGNGYGFFDIGYLSAPNSWGIFKNVNYAIMEVKDYMNVYDQAWSPSSWTFDGKWHFIAAPWERTNETTYFKICLDAECKNEYDGITPNSFPNLSKNFCVGWNGWYGYSESIIDEFKIFNYAKSNQEIYEDYLKLANKTFINYTKKDCVMYKPESNGKVKINCSGLYVDNKPFTAKGAGYQPMPIGKTATSLTDKQQMYDDISIRKRDFPLLREMNANTIRTWGEVMNKSWLDDLYNNGKNPIYVVMGFWINCGENYGDPAIRQKYIDAFRTYVTKYKDNPAVLMWGLGNENNYGFCSSEVYLPHFYSLANELAKVAYEIEGENYHPIGIISGDLGYIGFKEFNADDASLDYIDYWGNNVYPGKTFSDWFDRYSSLSGKPLFISEYGIDALNDTDKKEYEEVHSEWVVRQWREIDEADVTIGSTLMEYSDEWWKAGNYWSHDYRGYPTSRHPDGYGNEEWWGVVRVKDNGSALDIVEPRKVYYDLKLEWGKGLEGDVNGDCKVDIFDLAKIGLCYGQAAAGNCQAADLNKDGKVNIFDLAEVGLNYGKSC